MHFVKDKPIVTIHRTSGSHWEITDREMSAVTDTRPISQIPIAEFIKPKAFSWLDHEIDLIDDELAKATIDNMKWIERLMESQSGDRAEEFKKMVMGHWHTENAPTYYINTRGKKVGEMTDVMIGPSRSGKSAINMHIAKHRHSSN